MSDARERVVEELTQAQHDAWPGVDADFIVNTEAIMPIIDRLLADRTPDSFTITTSTDGTTVATTGHVHTPDLDAVLDAVHPECMIGMARHEYDGVWYAEIRYPYTDSIPTDEQTFKESWATGPTRMSAIADACRKAREVQGE